MAKLRRYALEVLIFGLVIVVLITMQVGLERIVDVFLAANLAYLWMYLLVSLLLAFVLTFKWQLVLKSQGMRAPFHRLFAYRLVGYSVGYLTPTMHAGSEPIRAVLLNREGIPMNAAFSNVIIDKSIELIANVVFFFIGALLLLNSVLVEREMKITILALSLILMLLMGMFVAGILNKKSMFLAIFRFFRLDRIRRLAKIETNLTAIERQVEEFYRKKKSYFLGMVGVMIVLWILMYFEYRFVLQLLGQHASITQIFLILTGVGIAYSIPVPAAVGTLELGQLSAAKVLELSSVTAIALAWLIRARDLVWTVFGLAFMVFYHFDFKRLAKDTKEIDEDFEKGELFRRRGT